MRIVHVAVALSAVTASLVGLRVLAQQSAPAATPATPDALTEDGRITHATPNTVRLAGPNVYAAAASITQAVYGASHHEDRPHAITLVRADRQAHAMLAVSRITHFPVNSPVLYVDADRLPPETLAEMRRLGPDGNTYHADVQVYLVGPISERVEREVQRELGYKTFAFRTEDPFLLSEELDTWAAAVHADRPHEAIIVQVDHLDTGLPGVAWNAHMGHALFFVQGDTVPEATKRALARRSGGALIYLFGDQAILSESVQRELSAFGHVQRVAGRDAYDISLSFASYRDWGMAMGHWIGSRSRDFGWGIQEPGHNFTFANPAYWQQAVTGSLLSHMGKHGPMILVRPEGLSEAAAQYLDRVKPSEGAPNDQLNNHGWILGGIDQIRWGAQADIDLVLEPRVSVE